MNDEKSILVQLHELQVIVNKSCAVKIDLPESLQVGAIIAKLPSLWNRCRKKLLHNSEDYSLEQLMNHLRIEETLKVREKLEKMSIGSSSRAHSVDELMKSKKAHENILGPKKDRDKFKNSSKIKPNVSCYVYGKSGYYTHDCRHCNGQKNEADATNAGDD